MSHFWQLVDILLIENFNNFDNAARAVEEGGEGGGEEISEAVTICHEWLNKI